MKMTFRWYGSAIDPIPLRYVKQIPGMTGLTLAQAEELLKQNFLTISPNLEYTDTRNAREHGTIVEQSPTGDSDVMLNTSVSLRIYRYPTDRADKTITVKLEETEENITLRVTLQAEGSEVEYEAYEYVYQADQERIQSVSFNVPDDRAYTHTSSNNNFIFCFL